MQTSFQTVRMAGKPVGPQPGFGAATRTAAAEQKAGPEKKEGSQGTCFIKSLINIFKPIWTAIAGIFTWITNLFTGLGGGEPAAPVGKAKASASEATAASKEPAKPVRPENFKPMDVLQALIEKFKPKTGEPAGNSEVKPGKKLSIEQIRKKVATLKTEIAQFLGFPAALPLPKIVVGKIGEVVDGVPIMDVRGYNIAKDNLIGLPVEPLQKNEEQLEDVLPHEMSEIWMAWQRSRIDSGKRAQLLHEIVIDNIKKGEDAVLVGTRRTRMPGVDESIPLADFFWPSAYWSESLMKGMVRHPVAWSQPLRDKVAGIVSEMLTDSASWHQAFEKNQFNRSGFADEVLEKLSPGMKEKAAKLDRQIKDILYDHRDFSRQFINRYETQDDNIAQKHLFQYIKAQINRVRFVKEIMENEATDMQARYRFPQGETIPDTELKTMIQTRLETLEGTARTRSGLFGPDPVDQRAYFFSPNEIQARNTAVDFQLGRLKPGVESEAKKQTLERERFTNVLGEQYRIRERLLLNDPDNTELQAENSRLREAILSLSAGTAAAPYIQEAFKPDR